MKRLAKKDKKKQAHPQLTQDEFWRFVNEEAFSRFNSEVKDINFHHEKGFLLSTKENYCLTKEITDTIDAHQWSGFASHPKPIAYLVKEFYAHILTDGQNFSKGTQSLIIISIC